MTLFRNVFEPNQPKHYQYPKSKYKETDPSPLAFQLNWYRRYPWLHYSVEKDAAFCFYCCKYLETHDLSKWVEAAYTVTGSRNWKRALESKKGFGKLQSSGLHKKEKDEFHPEIQNRDLPEMMSLNLKNERKNNQDMLLKILSSMQSCTLIEMPLQKVEPSIYSQYLSLKTAHNIKRKINYYQGKCLTS